MSPGQIDGSMLKPLTRRRSTPNLRITSAARSHFNSCVAVASTKAASRNFLVEFAVPLGHVDLAAGQRHRLEDPLVPERRLLVRFPGVAGAHRLFWLRRIFLSAHDS